MISRRSDRTQCGITYGGPGTTSSRVPGRRPGRPRLGNSATRTTAAHERNDGFRGEKRWGAERAPREPPNCFLVRPSRRTDSCVPLRWPGPSRQGVEHPPKAQAGEVRQVHCCELAHALGHQAQPESGVVDATSREPGFRRVLLKVRCRAALSPSDRGWSRSPVRLMSSEVGPVLALVAWIRRPES